MTLTIQEQQFLDQVLQTRATSKGQLGGRALSKIKDQYQKYCKEQRKVREQLTELERLPGGEELARGPVTLLKLLNQRVDTATDQGDETIFKVAQKELESIRKECEKLQKHRKSEVEAVAKDIEKFAKVYRKALGEKDGTKKQAALKVIKEKIDQWLVDHHQAGDRGQAWAVRELVVEALGGPGPDDLRAAVLALESQAYALEKEVLKWDETGLDWITINTSYSFDTQVYQLLSSVEKFIEIARKDKNGFQEKQLVRVQQMVNRLRWIVDPPPVPTDPPPNPPAQTGSDSTGSDVGSSTDSDVTDVPVRSLEERVESAFQKAGRLIEHFENEHARVQKNLQDFENEVRDLKQRTDSAKDLLATDYRMLDTAVDNARKLLAAVDEPLKSVQMGQQEVVNLSSEKGQALLKKIATASEAGLRQLAACEKATGQIEGGLLYIQRAFDSIQALSRRVTEVDEELLDTLLAKVPLLKACDGKADGDELDLLKQLVFVSALENGKISQLLNGINNQKSLDKAIRKLMEEPKLSSSEMTLLLSQCHQIIVDADRFFGDWGAYAGTLDGGAKAKLQKISDAAKQDVARYTIPFVPRPRKADKTSPLQSVGVAVVGGGPIGLLAAVEARMSGASEVHVFEGRTDPYSRLNVLKIMDPQLQRFRAAGVFDAIFPAPPIQGQPWVASVKSIEEALESRCSMLGVKLERGLFLTDVRRNERGEVELLFKGQEGTPSTCDLLILATGSSIASAQKHANNVVLSDQLGIPFQKSTVKDYAAVGVFAKDGPEPASAKQQTDGWAYDFETEEVKYLVTQLSEEEYEAYCNDPRALRDRLIEDAAKVKLIGQPEQTVPARVTAASKVANIERDELSDAIDQAWTQLLQELGGNQFYGRDVDQDQQRIEKAKRRALMSLERTLDQKKKKNEAEKVSPAEVEDVVLTFLNMELGVGRFPMEFQQAQKFAMDDLSGVLVGDSAATPHPSTAKGLNTGVDEMGSIRDLVEDLEVGGGSEEERKKAMQAYQWEVKRRTDKMVGLALEALQTGARERCTNLAKPIWTLVKTRGADYWKINNKIKDHINATMLIPDDSDEARNDEDWSKRDAAVKKIRAFEKSLRTAKEDVAKLVLADDTASADTLLAPFYQLFP